MSSKNIKKFGDFDKIKEEELLESCGGSFTSCGGGDYSSSDNERVERAARRSRLVRKLKSGGSCKHCNGPLKGTEKFCPECGESTK